MDAVMMPVEAMGPYCLTCPELDIDIVTQELYALQMVEEGQTSVKNVSYENKLRCKHCDRCKVILEHEKSAATEPMDDFFSGKSTKPEKKTATKSTAKKTTKATTKRTAKT